MENTIKEKLYAVGAKQVLNYLEKDPEVNIPKILNWLEKYAPENSIGKHVKGVRPYLTDKDNNWYKLIMRMYTDIDPFVRKKLFENFIINGAMLGFPQEIRAREKYNCNVPWAILLDPTSACNLQCTGCWAAEYGNKLNLSFDEISSIQIAVETMQDTLRDGPLSAPMQSF